MSKPLEFYVYEDRKPCGEPFYVGKGNHNRIANPHRNRIHTNICRKYPDWRRVVVFAGTEQECFAEEVRLIALYGRRNTGTGSLVNLTDGGEGAAGMVHTDDAKKRVSISTKAAHARPDVKAKHAAAVKAALTRPEVRAKLSAASQAAHARPDFKAKQSAAMRAAMVRPEVKAKLSASSKAAHARPDVKAKHAAAVKAALARPDVKEKRSATIKAVHARPEVKAKRSTPFFVNGVFAFGAVIECAQQGFAGKTHRIWRAIQELNRQFKQYGICAEKTIYDENGKAFTLRRASPQETEDNTPAWLEKRK